MADFNPTFGVSDVHQAAFADPNNFFQNQLNNNAAGMQQTNQFLGNQRNASNADFQAGQDRFWDWSAGKDQEAAEFHRLMANMGNAKPVGTYSPGNAGGLSSFSGLPLNTGARSKAAGAGMSVRDYLMANPTGKVDYGGALPDLSKGPNPIQDVGGGGSSYSPNSRLPQSQLNTGFPRQQGTDTLRNALANQMAPHYMPGTGLPTAFDNPMQPYSRQPGGVMGVGQPGMGTKDGWGFGGVQQEVPWTDPFGQNAPGG